MARTLRASLARAILGGLFLAAGCAPEGPPSGRDDEPVLRLEDLNGRWVSPLDVSDERAVVVFFVGTDCPISNRYAPELRRLHEAYSPRGVAFWLVYTDPAESAEAIRHHVQEFGYPFGALQDRSHELVRRAGARITPEAAVFRDGELVYRGRIDDWYVDFGRARVAPTQHDVQDALEAVLAGRLPQSRESQAIGCAIPPLE